MTDCAISVVVPTVDGRDLLRASLPPLMEELSRLGRWELIIANAGSSDGTPDLVRQLVPEAVVLASAARLDFGANCNRAVASARHPLVLLLNDDVRVTPGFLAPLMAASSVADTFAVTPAILRDGPPPDPPVNEAVHRTFFGFGLIYHERLDVAHLPAHTDGWPVPFACGAAAMYRRDRFLELGGFDDLFAPFYWEDFDLCYRAWKRGWRTVYEPQSVVHHAHRKTIGRFYTRADIEAIHEGNRFLFAWKNLTNPVLTGVHLACLPIKLLEALVQRRPAVGAGFRLARRRLALARDRRRVERSIRGRGDWDVLREFARMSRAITRAARGGAGAR